MSEDDGLLVWWTLAVWLWGASALLGLLGGPAQDRAMLGSALLVAAAGCVASWRAQAP